jgi:hypothetical protein
MKVYVVKIALDTVFVAPDNATKEEVEELALKAVRNEVKENINTYWLHRIKVALGTKKSLAGLGDVIPWFSKGEKMVYDYMGWELRCA